MAFPQGIYFRSTDDQTDPTNYDCIAGGTNPGISYPFTTAQGNTVGWEAAPAGGRDRGGAGAVELRGMHFVGAAAKDFRIDLPATGSYNIRAAFGDQTSAQAGSKAQFKDTTTVFATPVPAATTISAGNFIDATGTNRTSQSDWTTNNAALTSQSFATTIFRVAVGGSSGNAPIAAVYIEAAGGSTTFNQSITATLTRAAAIVKLVKKTLGPVTLTRTAAVQKRVSKGLSASLTRSASLARVSLFHQTLTASRTRTASLLAGIVSKKTLTATLTRTAALATNTLVGGGARLWRLCALALGLRT
jgi:hypothetical protein